MYEIYEGKKLRCGYTTGSCAQAATVACCMLLNGEVLNEVEIETNSGQRLIIPIYGHKIEEGTAECYTIKDSGDDKDVTNGIEIYARVKKRFDGNVNIDGGIGIGRFTLDTPYGKKGEAAINKVPRKMIEGEVRKFFSGAEVLIFAPKGEEISKKTFNKRLKIEGGISILGTTGIVKPMSNEALIKTIYMELDLKRKTTDEVILVLGNHGEEFAKNMFNKDCVIVSNFIGDSVLYAKAIGFKKIILIGHIGKLCKLSIGAFNTHSHINDSRTEAFVYFLAKNHIGFDVIDKVIELTTAEEITVYLVDNGYKEIIFDMVKTAEDKIKALANDYIDFNLIMYTFRGDVFEGSRNRTR
ncbi:MAG: cobalt-precorrin-5B (C(1))-methyltransferase CbiD [Clostridiales bacterium]|nr:cobalt-precorrin-5B (C(1))-methyltransferase CbiD [Clostridiales bacterium]